MALKISRLPLPAIIAALIFATLTNVIINSNNTYAASETRCLRHVFESKITTARGPVKGGKTVTTTSDSYGPWICLKLQNDKITSEKATFTPSDKDGINYKNGNPKKDDATKNDDSKALKSKVKNFQTNLLYVQNYSKNKQGKVAVSLIGKVYGYDEAGRNAREGKSPAAYGNVSNYSSTTKGTSWEDFKKNMSTKGSGGNGAATRKTITTKFKGIEEKSGKDAEEIAGASEDAGGSNSSEDADPCYSGAGVLGHVICPLLKNFGELADSAYVNWIQPVLMIEPELVGDNGDNGTFAGWQIFQNFANIAFIIMLLIVILSQVTGVGLSNYGIKKTLPKLVIAAILINISYIICQLAVDLSNVLGVGLKSLMDGLTAQLQENLTINEVVFNANAKTGIDGWQTGDTVAALALLAGVIAGAGTLLAQGMAVLLPLIFAAITVVIGIMFFFILLSVRKAGVVLLVVLSPIAFVCYMLPNTKKLFDRWFKAFSGLLLLFPICGLIIGGGDFASTILLNVNAGDGEKIDFFFALTAMIVGIVPIFFIPMLLRNSMSALGNIGARISNRGQALRGGINKRIADSDAYKMTSARLAAGRQGGLRQRLASGQIGKEGGRLRKAAGFASKYTGTQGRTARNIIRYNKMVAEQGALDTAFGKNFLLKTQTANEMKRLESTGEINDSAKLKTGLTNALLKNDQAKINAYSDALLAKGDSGRDDFGAAWGSAIQQGFGSRGNSADIEAAKAAGNNVMENHAADVKNNARSLFDAMNKATSGEIQTREAAATATQLSENMKPQTAAAMDDYEFELATGYNKAGDKVRDVELSDRANENLRTIANTMAESPELFSGTKAPRIRVIQDMVGNRVDIQHNRRTTASNSSPSRNGRSPLGRRDRR